MNMMKLRQILEMRRANKAPPLIPPRLKRGSDGEFKRGTKELIDVHLSLRNFNPGLKSKSNSIVLIISESEDSAQGWRVTTSSDILQKTGRFDLKSVFSIEFQFEQCQYIKLDICDWREYTAVSLGYTIFAVSELVTKRDGTIARDVVDDELGQTVARALISCSLRPRPHSILLQFYVRNLKIRKNIMANAVQVFFEVHQVRDDEENKVLYRSECTKYSSQTFFRAFSLQSTDILNDIVEVVCFYRDSRNPKVPVGSFQVTYDQLSQPLTQKPTYTLTYETSKNQKKVSGEFDLLKFNEMILPSFLEFMSSGTTLNIAFAVDLTQSEQAVNLEFVQQYVNDVELAIKSIGEPLRYFNSTNSYTAFGFGARIPPHSRESHEFHLNLENDPHCRGVEGVLDAFKTAFANTQPINIAHLSHVIYYVSKLAQNALNRSKNSVYYVLIMITRGVFDDIKETVQSLIFASRVPISVVFVGVGEMTNLGELERLGAAGTRLNYHGRKPERDCIQSVLIPKCREEEQNPAELRALIAEKALSQIPWQLQTFMSRNGIRPQGSDQMTQALSHKMYTTLEYSWRPMGTPSAYSLSDRTVNGTPEEAFPVRSVSGSSAASIERPPSRHSTSSGSQQQHSMMQQAAECGRYQQRHYSYDPQQQFAYEQQVAYEQVEADVESVQSISSVEIQHLKAVPHQKQHTPRLHSRSDSTQSSPASHYHVQQYPQRPSSRQDRY